MTEVVVMDEDCRKCWCPEEIALLEYRLNIGCAYAFALGQAEENCSACLNLHDQRRIRREERERVKAALLGFFPQHDLSHILDVSAFIDRMGDK